MHTTTPLRTGALLALSAFAAAAPTRAQDLPGVLVVRTEFTRPTDLDVPQPPKAVLARQNEPPVHQREVVPPGGPGLPQPVVPPVELDGAPPVVISAADLVTLRTSPASAVGGNRSSSAALEPTATSPDNLQTMLATGNWYASFSTNGGLSWTYRNPYTTFSAAANGFCCDQVTATRNGATFWYLQYDKTVVGNAARVACAPNVAALGAGVFPFSWLFTAQQFGFPPGAWLDFPDMATTNASLFCSSNVFDQNSANLGRVVWRLSLADMIAGLPTVTTHYYSDNVGQGWRLSHGAEDTMYMASPLTSSSLSIARWNDASTTRVTLGSRTISAWSWPSGGGNPGPDNLSWSGRADGRLTGGYFAPARFRGTARYGFYWASDPIGSYTKLHVRGAVFDAATDSLVEQPVIWNANYACAYPAVGANGFGHRGVAFAFGGGTSFPSTAFQLEDDLGTAALTFAGGASGPSGNRWGDYLWVQSGGGFDTNPQYLCTGMACTSSGAGATPVVATLSRLGFDDAAIGISVLTYPTGVAASVTMSPVDRFAQGTGTAPFYRAVAFSSGSYTFTAPAFANGTGGQRHAFVAWHRKFAPFQVHAAQPAGQRAYVMATGNATFPTELVAEYTPLWDISISANVATNITLSPADFNGLTTVNPPKVVQYVQGSSVTLTAPTSTPNQDVFDHWVVDGAPRATGVNTLAFTNLGGNHTAQAVYRVFQAGSTLNYGPGCAGSGGFMSHTVATTATGGPQVGATVNYNLASGRASSPAFLLLGVSDTTWLGVPLPISLAGAGANGCFLRHDPLLILATATNQSRAATVPIAWPNDLSLIGGNHYTTFGVFDPPANTLGIAFSNSYRVTLGGAR